MTRVFFNKNVYVFSSSAIYLEVSIRATFLSSIQSCLRCCWHFFYNPNFVIAIMSRKLNRRCAKILFVSHEFNVLCVCVTSQMIFTLVRMCCVCRFVFICLLFCKVKSVHDFIFVVADYVFMCRIEIAHTICALKFYFLCLYVCVSHCHTHRPWGIQPRQYKNRWLVRVKMEWLKSKHVYRITKEQKKNLKW